MNTQIIKIDKDNIDKEKINKAGTIIRDGGLVAFPTETVYGLGANALCESAVKSTFIAKGRPSDNPLIIHITDKNDILKIAREFPPMAKKLVDAFSPGAFTIILKKQYNIPECVTAGLDTVAIRIPSNPVARELITAAGVPISAPSANVSGKPSPTEAKHVIADMDGRIDCIIDGGSCDVGIESTVVDATGEYPIILRPGGVTFDDIKKICPDVRIDRHIIDSVTVTDTPRSPGMKYKHYSPDADVVVVEGELDNVYRKILSLIEENKNTGKKIGVMTMTNNTYDADCILNVGTSNKDYAKNLFAKLREFDDNKIDIVFAEFCDLDDYGLSVKNRLYKSAGNKVIHV